MYEDKERQDYLKRLSQYACEVVADPVRAAALLYGAGITTKSGNLTKPYKDLDKIFVPIQG